MTSPNAADPAAAGWNDAPPETSLDGPAAQGASRARIGHDRRTGPTPRWSRFSFGGGRRRGGRRDGERENVFVDQYSTRVWLLLLWVALMNVADSFFTLLHLQDGGIEVNPFAAWMLTAGRSGFVIMKSLLITLPLIVLCIHKNFPLARLGLYVAAGTYTLLCAYHIWLL